jgi:hypothetical protein
VNNEPRWRLKGDASHRHKAVIFEHFRSTLDPQLQRATLGIMPDRSRKPRPRDPNQLAKLIVDIATGQVEDKPDPRPGDSAKDPAAVALGRRGGLKGGKARAAAMTPERRAEIARKAAAKRWSSK